MGPARRNASCETEPGETEDHRASGKTPDDHRVLSRPELETLERRDGYSDRQEERAGFEHADHPLGAARRRYTPARHTSPLTGAAR